MSMQNEFDVSFFNPRVITLLHLISPYNITSVSHIKVTRIMEEHRKCIEKSMKNVNCDARI